MDMEVDEDAIVLPEELVERILAMVPFPHILKGRVLSRSWLAKLSSTSSIQDEEEKRKAISFQKRMSHHWSANWMSLCPVFFSKEDLIGYDRATRQWRRIPTLSFLPENHITKSKHSQLQIEGGLLFIVSPPKHLSVANVLTRSWKQLPPRPWADGRSCGRESLVSHIDAYKVVEFYRYQDGLCFALIYNSELSAWNRRAVEVPRDFNFLSNRVSLNGVLYWMVGLNGIALCLLAFQVEEEVFEVLPLPPISGTPNLGIGGPFTRSRIQCFPVVCCGSLLMVVCNNDLLVETVSILKIDLVSQRWLEVARGPPAALNFGKFRFRKWHASDGDCIFFMGENFDQVLAYNVQNNEWSCFPIPPEVLFGDSISSREYQMISFSFQPSLNPFVAL
jgi:hypothetical protein